MLVENIESLKEELKVAEKQKDKYKRLWSCLHSESMSPTASPVKGAR